jgi:predicted nucleic acid-binding protein
MRHGEPAFVDSGAWIALALSRDPLHAEAREQWEKLRSSGAKLHTSVPVVIETFTFLERNANRDPQNSRSLKQIVGMKTIRRELLDLWVANC